MAITVNATAITFNNGSVQTTAATATGTVTSVATGNGLSGGTITTTGTLVVACPTFNSVGSYCFAFSSPATSLSSGSNYAAGNGTNQIRSGAWIENCGWSSRSDTNLSGTWKWMAAGASDPQALGVACRVS